MIIIQFAAMNVDIETIVPCDDATLVLDDDISALLSGYRIYTAEGKYRYPFILIHVQPCDVYVAYPLYRFVAKLPFTSFVTDRYRLPVVDHIMRNPMLTRRTDLRLCTTSQNLHNNCRKRGDLHGVTGTGRMDVFRDSQSHRTIVQYAFLWINMLMSAGIPSFSSNSDDSRFQILCKQACKYKFLSETIENLAYIDQFVYAVIHVLQSKRNDVYVCPFTIHKSAIPTDFHDHAVLHDVHTRCAASFKKRTSLPGPLGLVLAGLHHDICKFVVDSVFSHFNFIKNTETHTCADYHVCGDTDTPADVLNSYEDMMDDTARHLCRQQMNVPNISLQYTMQPPGGISAIRATEKEKPTNIKDKGYEVLATRYITHPHTVFPTGAHREMM